MNSRQLEVLAGDLRGSSSCPGLNTEHRWTWSPHTGSDVLLMGTADTQTRSKYVLNGGGGEGRKFCLPINIQADSLLKILF